MTPNDDRIVIQLARLIADRQTVPHTDLVAEVAQQIHITGSVRRASGESNGTALAAYTRKFMQPLQRAGLVRRDGDVWVVASQEGLAEVFRNASPAS